MLAEGLFCLYALDRIYKLLAVIQFFRAKQNLSLNDAPSVTLIQPITRGASALEGNLRARFRMEYPGVVEYIFVCDGEDKADQEICRSVSAEFPQACVKTELVDSEGAIASKIAKMQAGVKAATGEVLCFIDDDVAPRPDNLTRFVRELMHPGTGAVFGVACYTNWREPGSALMSAFVNANALFTYIPLTLLTPPFTITGHFFAVWRTVWNESGGLEGLAPERNDDDHEIARRIGKTGKHIAQSDAIYDGDNALPSLRDYNRQMKRWSAFMRLWCWPQMSGRARAASLFNMIGNIIPGMALLLAAAVPGRETLTAFTLIVVFLVGAYLFCTARYLKQETPVARIACIIAASLISPFQMLLSPLGGNLIFWRGRRYRVRSGGLLEVAE